MFVPEDTAFYEVLNVIQNSLQFAEYEATILVTVHYVYGAAYRRCHRRPSDKLFGRDTEAASELTVQLDPSMDGRMN